MHSVSMVTCVSSVLPPSDDDAGQVEGLSEVGRREQLPGVRSDDGWAQHRDEV